MRRFLVLAALVSAVMVLLPADAEARRRGVHVHAGGGHRAAVVRLAVPDTGEPPLVAQAPMVAATIAAPTIGRAPMAAATTAVPTIGRATIVPGSRPASPLARWRPGQPQRLRRTITVTDTAIRPAIRACASSRSGPAPIINGSGSASAE